MDGQDLRHADALGFPLGTAVIMVLFFLSGFLSCCYRWARHRSTSPFNWPGTNPDAEDIESPPKSTPSHLESRQKQNQSLPVIMPGDEIPKFIACPCPCEPSSTQTRLKFNCRPQRCSTAMNVANISQCIV